MWGVQSILGFYLASIWCIDLLQGSYNGNYPPENVLEKGPLGNPVSLHRKAPQNPQVFEKSPAVGGRARLLQHAGSSFEAGGLGFLGF